MTLTSVVGAPDKETVMNRTTTALLTALLLLLAACGSGGEASGDETADAGGATADGTEEAAGDDGTAEATQAAEGDDLTVGVANLGLSFPFPASIGEGIAAAADELGVQVVELDAAGDAATQSDDVEDLIAQGVDGVLLLPVDSAVAEGVVDRLVEADIPVVAVASQVGDPEQREIEDVYEGLVALVTQEEVAAGEQAAEIVLDVVPDGGDVAIVEGQAGFAEVSTRAVGFEEVLESAEAEYEIVARQPGDWLPDVAEATCQNLLASNPDLAAIYAQSDDMAAGCAEAADAAGVEVPIVGIGGAALGIDAIAAGDIAGTVCYKPIDMGELAMQTLYDHLTGASTETEQFVTYETPAITAENVDDCEPQW